MTLRTMSIALLIIALVYTSFSQPATLIYAAQFDDAQKRVYSCGLDGSGRTSFSMTLRPKYLAIDWKSYPQKLYVGLVPMSGNGKIVRCNTDGSNIEDVVTDLVGINDIELDLTHRMIFWLQNTYNDDRIFHADMDGLNSNVTQIYATTTPAQDLWGLALDVQNQLLWITERGGTCYSSYIRRMTFSGSSKTLIASPVCNPHDIEYYDGHIYWGETGGILRANPDGSGVDTVVTVASIQGLAIDATNNRIYWTDYNLNNIKRVDYDGTNELAIVEAVGQFAGIDTDYNPAAVPVERPVQLPRTHALLQNYPNPFNPSTKIPYAVAEAVHVNLRVCNILGQTVAVLVDAPQQPGVYEAVFNGEGLPSGLYFYALKAGEFQAVKRMVVLK
jgi:hypothetical protein